MLRIPCPICGTRDEIEFNYGGDASIVCPEITEVAPEPWIDYLFKRKNIRGSTKEYWHHASGCRQWLVIQRDTRSHQISSACLTRNQFKTAANSDSA
ncbi:MAG: sarcosine oxidase subunit delta [Candidatus Tectomicrobia bacterium]